MGRDEGAGEDGDAGEAGGRGGSRVGVGAKGRDRGGRRGLPLPGGRGAQPSWAWTVQTGPELVERMVSISTQYMPPDMGVMVISEA